MRHDFGHELLAEVVESNNAQLPQAGSRIVLDPHVSIFRTSGFGELLFATGSVDDLLRAFIEMPISVTPDRLVFVEPLACAYHCVGNLLRFEQKRNLKGMSVGIVGAGMTGTLIGLLCIYYGAGVTIVNRSQQRLDFLESKSLFGKKDLRLAHRIGRKFDVVIPTTTFLLPEILRLCEQVVKDMGLILLYGGTKAGDIFPLRDEVDIDQIRRTEGMQFIQADKPFRVGGTHGAKTADFKSMADLLSKHPLAIPVEKLITNRILLQDVPQIISEMANKDSLGKTVVTNYGR